MREPPSIPRHKGEPGEFSFDSLRREGIATVQGLSGSVWTDYNAHDPGVTILEQVCFGLTDLLYRADFPVPDLLVDDKGLIDWGRQALLPPEAAFPARATTELDHRIHILNAVPEVENIEMHTAGNGLYSLRLRVRPSPDLPAGDSRIEGRPDNLADVIQRVHQAFLETRNLCEDLEAIEVVPTIEYHLRVQIELRDAADPVEVMAQAYHACEVWLAAGLEFLPYDRALLDGGLPEVIFRGPFSGRGVMKTDHGLPPTEFPASDILPLIRQIPDVDRVTLPPQPNIAGGGQSARLHWPQTQEEIEVKLFRNGRPVRVWLDQLNMRYKELNFTDRGVTFGPQDVDSILPRPRAKVRDIMAYESIQHHFPPVYGLGRNSLPQNSDERGKARVRQLRSYLVFFDQHMADFLAMLANVRRLFSLEVERQNTYFFQAMTEESFPGVEEAYKRYATGHLKRTIASQRYNSRTNRLLDYMLALYGEAFRDAALKTDAPGKNLSEEESLFHARLEYLRYIEEVTRDRGGARDYSRAPDANPRRPGLELKLSHLLGFEQDHAAGERVRVVESLLLRVKDGAFRVTVLFPDWPERCKDMRFRSYAEQLVDTMCPAHIYADIYWLTPHQFDHFDELHDQWWQCYRKSELLRLSPQGLRDDDPAARDTNQTASALVKFLTEMDAGRSES